MKVRKPFEFPLSKFRFLLESSKPTQIANIISTNVSEGPNKIFVGGLPSYLNEEQVKQLLTTFGPLKSFNLVRDNNTGKFSVNFQ